MSYCDRHDVQVLLERVEREELAGLPRPYLKCDRCAKENLGLKWPGFNCWAKSKDTLAAYDVRRAEILDYLFWHNPSREDMKFLLDMYAISRAMSPAQSLKYHFLIHPLDEPVSPPRPISPLPSPEKVEPVPKLKRRVLTRPRVDIALSDSS